MTSVQRFAIGLFVVTAAAAAGFVMTAPRVVESRRGSLAPVGGVDAPVRVAAIDADRLTPGPVVAISAHRDAVYLLQNRSWLRVDASGVAGPFGSGVRGAAGVIASGAALAVTDSAVYVLDRLSRALLIYDPSGNWKRTILLRARAFDGLVPHAFVLDARERLLVSGHQAGPPARWTIVQLADESGTEIYARAGGPFDLLLPLADVRGRSYALSTADYVLEDLSDAGVVTRKFVRRDPPRVPFPSSAHTGVANSPVPDFIPAAAHAFARSTGTFLVAIAASPDEVWIEELDAGGRPLRTLLAAPIALPVGFSDNALYTLREEAQQTIVLRHQLRVP